jgi:hypothetical protein
MWAVIGGEFKTIQHGRFVVLDRDLEAALILQGAARGRPI